MSEGRTAFLHVIPLGGGCFLLVSKRMLLDGVRHSVKTEVEVHKTAWERSATVTYAVQLLTLQLFIHSHALLGSSSLCRLHADKLLEWDAVKQLQFTAPALLFIFASLPEKVLLALQIKVRAGERPRAVGLDGKSSVLSRLAKAAGMGLCP